MATRDAAEAIVRSISEKYGYLSEEDFEQLERIDPALRQRIERSYLAKDELAGHAIITLAQNIYGSDARFVFELLQNADDNKFTKANARDILPYVSFDVHPDRIIVECNEDGFTEQDLQAICTVGQSSKSASHGYIGAKGIGFKSVFIAAWKVHVQSGHYSFYFKHRRGDSGLGMAVPIWQETVDELQSPMTRMTLYLHDTQGEDHLTQLRTTIFKQLSDLQETSLLFLRKLKRIEIRFFDENDNLLSFRGLGSTINDIHRTILTTTETRSTGNEVRSSKHFHVTRHTATGLSRSVSRQIPDTQEAILAASSAEVVLAFPLTEDSDPIIESQELFAFLPVRASDFKFVIQSDFDTSANRQDIVTTSPRNKNLLDAIADAFIQAVHEFCQDPDLCYTWPRFLPLDRDGITAFWSELKTKIRSRISDRQILMSRHGTGLRRIRSLVKLPLDFQDEAGCPLLDHSPDSRFLSERYPRDVTDPYLSEYGLRLLKFNIIRDMMQVDLNSVDSKFKCVFTSQYWHTKMALVLKETTDLDAFRSLAFLPLRGGQWVSPNSGSIYLPTSAGIPVPQGIDLRILDASAVVNIDRKSMCEAFGAEEPSVVAVRSSICQSYDRTRMVLNLKESRDQLHFLYATHLYEPSPIRSNYTSFRVVVEDGVLERPARQDIYLRGHNPFGAQDLLAPRDGAPGFQVKYLRQSYMLEAPEAPRAGHISWTRWLHDFIGIREQLPLVNPDGSSLSPIWTYIATHRADRLLGFLEHVWSRQGSRVLQNPALVTQMQETNAIGLCEALLRTPCIIRQTYLPLPTLMRLRSRFMESAEPFPFLKLDTAMPPERLLMKWKFLNDVLLVGIDNSMSFLLDILAWIKHAHSDASMVARPERLFELYVTIYAKFMSSEDRSTQRQMIIEFLNEKECLYIPASSSGHAAWTGLRNCLWDAPPAIFYKYPLELTFTENLEPDQMSEVSQFFQNVLQIPDASWEDIVNELTFMRDSIIDEDQPKPNFDHILALYCYIADDVSEEFREYHELRKRFAEENLICHFSDGNAKWYKTSECLWSSTTDIRGKVTLHDEYEYLEDFFVHTIGVRTLTLQIVYDELLQTDSTSTVTEVKSMVGSLNALLQSEPTPLDPVPLVQKNIFPVSLPNGGTSLANVEEDFSIGDREYLIAHFGHRVKMLDYDLSGVRYLATFLEWTGLSNRYLSNSVKEMTSASHENVQAVSSMARDLRLKAHAILRVSASFSSPRYISNGFGLYRTLQSMHTVATDEISSVFSLSQDGTSITVEDSRRNMHIGEADGNITVYIPRNKPEQAFCFASRLPINLAAWLMRDPLTHIQDAVNPAMVSALSSFLSVEPYAVDMILDHQGIIQVAIVNEDPRVEEQEEDTSDCSTEQDLSSEPGEATTTLLSSEQQPPIDHGVIQVVVGEAATTSRMPRHAPIYAVSIEADNIRQENHYLDILKGVLHAVHHAHFPSQGAFDMSGLQNALQSDNSIEYDGFESAQRYRSGNQFERNVKIGAAGELYVFELMSKVNLRSWNRDNWQSRIRDRVAILEDYTGMRGWSAPETSDLVYDDTFGDFTSLLIDHGYLDGSQWTNARPYYFLEVKTTTGPCGTPFYMSKGQYQRMTGIHHARDKREVYLIFRVFHIENEHRMGMKVYVDPAKLELEKQLVFTSDGWSVTPGTT